MVKIFLDKEKIKSIDNLEPRKSHFRDNFPFGSNKKCHYTTNITPKQKKNKEFPISYNRWQSNIH
ncbi:hypothetical protein DERP_002701 [Dermatophagoides pteronyssinus]|uniref:Uncharacterized protein n=1 Tax=Dermatophagoides pteronyssinus TaxID=6956 RepID=A0ABQ8JVJ6_DERPT|nr:hypothetical protein DERP_002701 [Dermatophagoides pteronyssinus]